MNFDIQLVYGLVIGVVVFFLIGGFGINTAVKTPPQPSPPDASQPRVIPSNTSNNPHSTSPDQATTSAVRHQHAEGSTSSSNNVAHTNPASTQPPPATVAPSPFANTTGRHPPSSRQIATMTSPRAETIESALAKLTADERLDFELTLVSDVARMRSLPKGTPPSTLISMMSGDGKARKPIFPAAAPGQSPLTSLLAKQLADSTDISIREAINIIQDAQLDKAYAAFLRNIVQQKIETDVLMQKELNARVERYPALVKLGAAEAAPEAFSTSLGDESLAEMIRALGGQVGAPDPD